MCKERVLCHQNLQNPWWEGGERDTQGDRASEEVKMRDLEKLSCEKGCKGLEQAGGVPTPGSVQIQVDVALGARA